MARWRLSARGVAPGYRHRPLRGGITEAGFRHCRRQKKRPRAANQPVRRTWPVSQWNTAGSLLRLTPPAAAGAAFEPDLERGAGQLLPRGLLLVGQHAVDLLGGLLAHLGDLLHRPFAVVLETLERLAHGAG